MMKSIRKLLIMFAITFSMLLGICSCIAYADSYGINNTNLDFKKVVYVDVKGNDETGDGSIEKPFQTLFKSLSYLSDNNLKEDTAIVMNDGDYDWTAISSGYSCNVNEKFKGMKVSFIAKNPGKTYIHSTNGLELLILEKDSSWRINLKFYGLIFHNVTGDGTAVCLGGDSWGNEYYNCVFDSLYIGGWNYLDKEASVKTQNCLFNNCTSNGAYDTKPLKGESINTATTNEMIDPYSGTKTTCLTNIKIASDYTITSDGWQSEGTGTNPDNTEANIGVYGGEFAWGKWRINNQKTIINVKSEKEDVLITKNISTNVVIDNIKDIAAEDIMIKYDNEKLKFLGFTEVDGIKLVKKQIKDGLVRVILVSKGKDNIAESKKILLKLNFQGIGLGDASIEIAKGKVSDGIKMERDLSYDECGKNYITVEDFSDPSEDGEFSLIDLAIDGRHYGENADDKTDVIKNGIIDDDDLQKIADNMFDNPNYKFNN